MADAMSEERLAEITAFARRRDYGHAVVLGDCVEWCAGCAVDELLAENDRLRTQASYMREQIEQQAQVTEERKVQAVVYRALAEEHQKRGDKLSEQLAEIGETREQWGSRHKDGDVLWGFENEADARSGSAPGVTVHYRIVGQEREVPDA